MGKTIEFTEKGLNFCGTNSAAKSPTSNTFRMRAPTGKDPQEGATFSLASQGESHLKGIFKSDMAVGLEILL